MAFTIPSLQTIIDRPKGDLNARMGNSNALVPRSLAWITAHIVSGAVYGLYLYQAWIAKQVIPDTAETEYLDRWARVYGVTRVSLAKATGSVTAVGVAGSVIPTGAYLQRDDGVRYVVTGGPYVCLAAPLTAAVSIEAAAAGVAGNADIGTRIEFSSPPAGVVGRMVTTTAIAGGSDVGTDAALRAVLLARIQKPPQGGSRADYEGWVRECGRINGWTVDRAWVSSWTDDPNLSPGQVTARWTLADGSGAYPPWGGVVQDATQESQIAAYMPTVSPVAAEWVDSHLHIRDEYLIATVRRDGTVTLADTKAALLLALRDMYANWAEVDHAGCTIPLSAHYGVFAAAPGVKSFAISYPTADVVVPAYLYPAIQLADLLVTDGV